MTETGQCLDRILDMELKIGFAKDLTAEKLFLIRAGPILNFRGQYWYWYKWNWNKINRIEINEINSDPDVLGSTLLFLEKDPSYINIKQSYKDM